MKQKERSLQSTVIDALRYPLIVIVFAAHLFPPEQSAIPLEWTAGSLYAFMDEFFHNFVIGPVSTFFLFSGFLFFHKAPKEFDWSFYTSQWQKRLTTLLIPFILWNALKVLMLAMKGFGLEALGLDGSEDLATLQGLTAYEVFIGCFDEPLWYLRDLICMVALAPLFFLLFKYLKHWGALLLVLWHLSAIELPVTGFSTVGICYFGLGAYYGLSGRSILADFSRWGYLPFLLSLIIFTVGTIVDNTGPYNEYWIRAGRLLCVVGSIQVMGVVVERYPRVRDFCLKHAGSVFFLYAVHELYFKNWVNGAFFRIPFFQSPWGLVLGFPLKVLTLLAICHALHYLCQRLAPRCYALLTGGRA